MHDSLLTALRDFADCHAGLTRLTSLVLQENTVPVGRLVPGSSSTYLGLELVHQMDLRHAFVDGVELTSIHRFSMPNVASADYSELTVTAGMAVGPDGCEVSLRTLAVLDETFGNLRAGDHVLREDVAADPDVMRGCDTLRGWVDALTAESDDFAILFPISRVRT